MAREKRELVEVSPRDGLQNEPDIVSTANKLALIEKIDTGIDLDAAIDAAKFMGGVIGRATPVMVSRAPKWPA